MTGSRDRRAVFIALMLLLPATTALPGCIAPPRVVQPPAPPVPPQNNTTPPQWDAFCFESNVTPAAGAPGRLGTFTYQETQTENGSVRKFRIEARREGAFNESVLTNRTVTELNLTTFQVNTTRSTVASILRSERIAHHIVVLRDDSNRSLPTTADMTLVLPLNVTGPPDAYPWLWQRADYTDVLGKSGSWSYNLNGSMWAEMNASTNSRTVAYSPCIGGEGLCGFDGYVLHGLYGYSWSWFGRYRVDGPSRLEEGTNTFEIGGMRYFHSITRTSRVLSGLNFNAYDVKISWTDAGGSWEYRAVLCPGLPVPVYLRVGDNACGHSMIYEYELTALSLV